LAFPDGRDSDVHQQMFLDRRQKITESILEYVEELKNLAALAYPDLDKRARENIVRPIFLRNMKAQIREPMKFREFGNLTDAIKAASFIEAQLFREQFNGNNSSNLIGSNIAGALRNDLKNLIRSLLREERERHEKNATDVVQATI